MRDEQWGIKKEILKNKFKNFSHGRFLVLCWFNFGDYYLYNITSILTVIVINFDIGSSLGVKVTMREILSEIVYEGVYLTTIFILIILISFVIKLI